MPRAATSVATRTGSDPSWNAARIRVACALGHAAVQGPGQHAGLAQLLGDPVGAALGADEHDGPARPRPAISAVTRALSAGATCSDVVGHGGHAGLVAESTAWVTGSDR